MDIVDAFLALDGVRAAAPAPTRSVAEVAELFGVTRIDLVHYGG